jgi:hypothetical protein
MTAAVRVRRLQKPGDVAWAEALLEAELAGRLQARRGELMDPLEGDGLIAELEGAVWASSVGT